MNIFKEKISKFLAKKLAKRLPKEDFLAQLKEAWAPEMHGKDVDKIVEDTRKRIKASGIEDAFSSAGITDDDLRKVVQEIIDKRGAPIKVEEKPERNAPCPCGSGKKYKYCCGK